MTVFLSTLICTMFQVLSNGICSESSPLVHNVMETIQLIRMGTDAFSNEALEDFSRNIRNEYAATLKTVLEADLSIRQLSSSPLAASSIFDVLMRKQ